MATDDPSNLNPYASPQALSYEGTTVSREAALGRGTFLIGEVLATGWRLFWARKWVCIVGTFAVMVLYIAATMSCTFGFVLLSSLLPLRPAVAMASMNLVAQAAGWVIQALLFPGLLVFYLALTRGQPASLNDLFSGPAYFLRALPALVVFALLTGGPFLALQFVNQAFGDSPMAVLAAAAGMIVWVVPMIVLALLYSQYLFLIIDRGLRVRDSFRVSREITQGNRLRLLGLYLVMMLVYVFAFVPVAIGVGLMVASTAVSGTGGNVFMATGAILILASIPLAIAGIAVVAPWFGLAFTVAYLRMTGQPVAQLQARIDLPRAPALE
ncbi:MAG: hypothetical protein K1X74_00320 [Pirellulales bacterium]|nr:hypothetical protein [Pirellulales bacterium]